MSLDSVKVNIERIHAFYSLISYFLMPSLSICAGINSFMLSIMVLSIRFLTKSIKGMRQIMEKFRQRNGATQCKLLKGVGTGKILRECPLCVADASEFLEEVLKEYGIHK
jgi:hypothetical protein